ncbi:hypothetical protein MC885_018778 [Smutsia gigantea]|nr:hypothetical protein MC885_018778 [Smutsia gigantea]
MALSDRLFVCFLLWGGMELCYTQTTWRNETRSPGLSKVPVVVECLEAQLVVTVNKDLFGTGKLIRSADLTLGPENCEPLDQDDVVRFEVGLHRCGSTMQPQIRGGIEGRDKGYYVFCVEDLKAQTGHMGVSPTLEAMQEES